mmetsp:Transcript_2776/g.17277  ORF Transcript_2776/g.17277 Transcript_2776/m.17277 type:complete len:286 (+) Transcript_2776:103-960(+)
MGSSSTVRNQAQVADRVAHRAQRRPKCIRGVLLDVAGTLYVGNEALPGVSDALRRLRASDVGVVFASNSSKESSSSLANKLRRMGLHVESKGVYTALEVAKRYVQEKELHPRLFLQRQAKQWFEEGMELQHVDANAVVLGLDEEMLSYPSINQAFRILQRNPEAELIATSRSKYLKVEDGGLDVGLGAYVAALEFSTGKTAHIVGKPEASFFEQGMKMLGTLAEETVVVGDDVHDDVNAGQHLGLCGLLVKTGKYRPGDEINAATPPDATVQDFAAAVDWILEDR